MENIILIGMPACGKSTAGVLLAKKIGFGFIDTDLLIQKREGALLCDILKKRGAEGFIEVEEQVNAELSADRCVIATGGSVVYGEKAMNNLKSLGKTVYLKVGLEELEKRLNGEDIFARGVVMRKKGETLKELLDERVPLYEKYADVTIDCNNLSLDETVESIIKAYNILNSAAQINSAPRNFYLLKITRTEPLPTASASSFTSVIRPSLVYEYDVENVL